MITTDIATLLRACVVERDWGHPPAGVAAPPAALLPAVIERAAYHGVTNIAYLSLRQLVADPAALEALQQRYMLNVGRHLRILADLASLRLALDGAGIPWMCFKGPVLSEVVYPRADLRSYVDLDVLVEQPVFAAAVETLEGAGFRLLDRNWDLIGNEERGQLHVVLPFGTIADVHWHLLNRGVVRQSLSVPMRDVFANHRTVTIDGAPVRTLGSVDTLLHLCVHAALAGGNRLQWLKDIERVVASEPPAWDEVVAAARTWRAAASTGVMLERARRVLGADVPADVVARLLPSVGRRAADRVVSRVSPPHRTQSQRSIAALWAQSLRDATPHSLVLAGRVRRRVSRDGRTVARVRRESGAPTLAAFQPSGDDTARAAFLARVAGPSGGSP
jgi:hypothetical protein